jgi:hypothetical protein
MPLTTSPKIVTRATSLQSPSLQSPCCSANRVGAHSARNSGYVFLLIGSLICLLMAPDSVISQHNINYNDARLLGAINAILSYLEGSFGALVMACAGITAILSAAFGQYKASLGLLVIAVGSFILRSLMGTFFNDVGIQP